jgi:hypothetical protein
MHLALKIMCNGFVMRFAESVRQTGQKDRSSMSQKKTGSIQLKISIHHEKAIKNIAFIFL